MWKEKANCLEREYVFKDFVDAWSFMTKVAIVSEKMNHHPELINTYNKVVIKLSTHDSGNTITEKDYKLARIIDTLL